MGNNLELKIKDWYTKEFKDDELGAEIKDGITFADLDRALTDKKDVYDVLGVGDSIIRERCFEKLSNLLGVDYDNIYYRWLGTDDDEDGLVDKVVNTLKGKFGESVKKPSSKLTLTEDEGDVDLDTLCLDFLDQYGWLEKKDGYYLYEVTPYNDYFDAKQVADILDKCHSVDEFKEEIDSAYDYYDEYYYDLLKDFGEYLEKAGIEDYDEDLAQEALFNYLAISADYDYWLDDEYRAHIIIDTGDANYDFSLNPNNSYYSPEDFGLDDEEVLQYASLVWLVKQQGHTVDELKSVLAGNKSDNKFMDSVADEVFNATSSLNAVCFLCKATLRQLLEFKPTDTITISKCYMCGLFDPINGGGSVLDVNIEKPVVIPGNIVGDFGVDAGGSRYGYDVDDVYGLTDKAYDATISISGATNESLTEDVEDNLGNERLDTPRGTFKIYNGTWRDFKNEPDADQWGFWFDHSIPENADWNDVEKWYKIVHNWEKQHAIAVLYRDLAAEKQRAKEWEEKQKGLKESKTLTERRWNAAIKAGIELRDALDEGDDVERIREAIIACYDELYDKGLIDEYDHDDWTEEVRDCDFENEWGVDEDAVDYELDELYDLCDNIGAFLAITEADLDESLKEGNVSNPYYPIDKSDYDTLLVNVAVARTHGDKQAEVDISSSIYITANVDGGGLCLHKITSRGREQRKYVNSWREKSLREINDELNAQDWEVYESLSQEIGQAYRELSAKYGIDADKLVSEFMKAKYPQGFPDFNGDVIYSEKYWNEFVDWCEREKGVNLGESCKGKKSKSQEIMDKAKAKGYKVHSITNGSTLNYSDGSAGWKSLVGKNLADLANKVDNLAQLNESKKCRKKALKEDTNENGNLTIDLNTGVVRFIDAGQYNSWVELPDEAYWEDDDEKTSYNNKEWDRWILECAKPYIEECLDETSPEIKLVGELNYYHPKYYNYSTDEIDFTVSLTHDLLNSLVDEYLNKPEFVQFLKSSYKSYDGYWSHMANNADDFREQEDWKKLASILSFNSKDGFDKRQRSFAYEVLEGVGSGRADLILHWDDEEDVDESLKESKQTSYTVGGYKGKDDPIAKKDIAKAARYDVDADMEQLDDGSWELVITGDVDKVKDYVDNYLGLDSTGLDESLKEDAKSRRHAYTKDYFINLSSWDKEDCDRLHDYLEENPQVVKYAKSVLRRDNKKYSKGETDQDYLNMINADLEDQEYYLDDFSDAVFTMDTLPRDNLFKAIKDGIKKFGADTLKESAGTNEVLYIIKDNHGNQLSAPNPNDSELWDRVEAMEARGKRGLSVVVYTGKKDESLKEGKSIATGYVLATKDGKKFLGAKWEPVIISPDKTISTREDGIVDDLKMAFIWDAPISASTVDEYSKEFEVELVPKKVSIDRKTAAPISLKEDWYAFEYESGANPYIAKSEKERDRIIRKYQDRVEDLGSGNYLIHDREEDLFSIKEDTVKQGNSWVNKGKEGTHGKFKTKKAADAQRKAMFANGYKESLKEDAPLEQRKPYKVFVVGDHVKYVNNDGWTPSGENDIGRTGVIVADTQIGNLTTFHIKADDHRVIRGYNDDSFLAHPNNLEFVEESLKEGNDFSISEFEVQYQPQSKGYKIVHKQSKKAYPIYFKSYDEAKRYRKERPNILRRWIENTIESKDDSLKEAWQYAGLDKVTRYIRIYIDCQRQVADKVYELINNHRLKPEVEYYDDNRDYLYLKVNDMLFSIERFELDLKQLGIDYRESENPAVVGFDELKESLKESLEGKVCKNDGKELGDILTKEFGEGEFKHEGNFVFTFKTKDGVKRVVTEPADPDDEDYEEIKILSVKDDVKESLPESTDGKFAGYTLFDDKYEVVDYICDDTHTDDEVSQIVADKYPTTKIILKQVFKLDGKDIKEVEEESTVLKPKAKVEEKKETAKDRVLAKKSLKEEKPTQPPKPDFTHYGEWIWDEEEQDYYDSVTGDYSYEIIRGSELPAFGTEDEAHSWAILGESADWTSDEILAIVDKLNAEGIATTPNKAIADAYASNENPYRRFEVSKADDKDEWTIKVVWKDDTIEDDEIEESLENIPTITNLFGDYDF